MSDRAPLFPASFNFSNSAKPITPVRALLKSWAMPPARVPTASIRWAPWSCLSISVFSVTSWAIDRIPLAFPDASRSDALNHSQVMIFPSFRTLALRSTLDSSPFGRFGHPCSISDRDSSGRMSSKAFFPIASSAVHPKIRSAAGFHSTTPKSRSHTM